MSAEISKKQAQSIKYQITVAKLPLAKDIDDLVFDDNLINERLVRDLASGNFVTHHRDDVLVGGTGPGKTHRHRACRRPTRRKRRLFQRG